MVATAPLIITRDQDQQIGSMSLSIGAMWNGIFALSIFLHFVFPIFHILFMVYIYYVLYLFSNTGTLPAIHIGNTNYDATDASIIITEQPATEYSAQVYYQPVYLLFM